MNKAKIFVTILTTLAALTFVKPALAAVRCETQYGGTEVCVATGELQIDKEVLDPRNSGVYRDNLYVTDYLFKTADFVTFKLIVKNVGDNTLNNIKIVDTLPSFLFFVGGSVSEHKIDKLNSGESKEIEIKTQVVAESQLEADRVCGVNTAEVWADGDEHDKDTAKLCVTKKVLGITTLPKTGPSDTFLILSLSSLSGLAGIALLKFSKRIA